MLIGKNRCHDIEHNATEYNKTRHSNKNVTVSINDYADCRIFIAMPSFIILSDFVLNVVAPVFAYPISITKCLIVEDCAKQTTFDPNLFPQNLFFLLTQILGFWINSIVVIHPSPSPLTPIQEGAKTMQHNDTQNSYTQHYAT